MAGVPPPPSGRGRGMTLPAWMTGSTPGPPSGPGVPPTPIPSMAQASSYRPPGAPQFSSSIPTAHPQYARLNMPMQYSQPQNPQSILPPPSYPGSVRSFQVPSVAPPGPPPQAPPASYGFPGQYRPGGYPPPSASFQTQPSGNAGTQWLPQGSSPAPNLPAPLGPPQPTPTAVSAGGSSSDWQEHTAANGKIYYYNKRSQQSVWEKPADLMTPTEKADASTVWKEFTTAEGRKYYYNKNTKESKWTIPQELKEAREAAAAEKAEASTDGPKPAQPTTAPPASAPSLGAVQSQQVPPPTVPDADASQPASGAPVEATSQDIEEAKQSMPAVSKVNISPVEDTKAAAEEAPTYASKAEAKAAFKELLESHNVAIDWTWEQAMKGIINDKRYGALKTLGERRQAFNEYIAQRKKADVEEKRLRHKKAREDFLVMLQESKELTSSMKWTKATSLFQFDMRFKALDKDRDREEIYEDYLRDLAKQEKEKAREARKKNQAEFRKFLESCDFITASSQWRKVRDKLEDDERCARLDKIDRLEGFQEYIRELEKKEEEDKELEREAARRRERKNRDAFRKFMEEQRAANAVHAKSRWRDYVTTIKDEPAYIALASNLSGSTPKELFEDAVEEASKQYAKDKATVKDIMKTGKIVVASDSLFTDFLAALKEAGDLEDVSDKSVELYFDDLLERAKEKDERDSRKKRKEEKEEDVEKSSKSKRDEKRSRDDDRGKDREREKKREKDKEREKERSKEKEREREKQKEKEQEKSKEREREKDREREKRREKEKVERAEREEEREKRKGKESKESEEASRGERKKRKSREEDKEEESADVEAEERSRDKKKKSRGEDSGEVQEEEHSHGEGKKSSSSKHHSRSKAGDEKERRSRKHGRSGDKKSSPP